MEAGRPQRRRSGLRQPRASRATLRKLERVGSRIVRRGTRHLSRSRGPSAPEIDLRHAFVARAEL
eukprot:10787754-Alexandrium_andersonii.AAC.1